MNVVRNFIRRFWNEGDTGCTEQFLAANYRDHAYQPGNQEGLKQMAGVLFAAFPDQVSVEESIAALKDRVIVRLRMLGTHRGAFRGMEATHKRIDVPLYREFRLTDGKISEHWALFDTLKLIHQLEN